MARLLQNHPSKRRNLTRGGRKDIAADSISSNEINSSSFYPSNSSRERTEYIPALNISGTSTLPDTAELETGQDINQKPKLAWRMLFHSYNNIYADWFARCCASSADHEFVLFCGSLTTYSSFLLPSATIVKITILFAAKTSKRSIFSFVMWRKAKPNKTIGLARLRFYFLDRAVENMSNKRKLNNFWNMSKCVLVKHWSPFLHPEKSK